MRSRAGTCEISTYSPCANQALAKMFALVGLTQEEAAAGHHPCALLAHALKQQMALPWFTYGSADRALVYAADSTDMTAVQGLREKYQDGAGFSHFAFFNDVACEACRQFGIDLQVLEYVNEDSIPASRMIVLDRPYMAGA